MKLTKFFIIFTLLLIFALQVSAQDKMPKIVWKNLQEKYESFYKIEALVVNESNLDNPAQMSDVHYRHLH